MGKVQIAGIGWALAGALPGVGAVLLWPGDPRFEMPFWGWAATLCYLVCSTAFVLFGLRRRGATTFGAANAVTAVRSALVGVVTGLIAASFAADVPAGLLVALVIPALALDGVDGWVARRTGSASELGAQFDMEVDAFLLLVLSIQVARGMGAWALVIGLLRYAFVVAGWLWPRLDRRLPYRYWRKVVTAFAGISLALAVSELAPVLAVFLVALALALLIESFGRDVIWLLRTPA
ncbi:CDP-alcohol phosphatidyltransferase family protein [Microbacterium tumbae]